MITTSYFSPAKIIASILEISLKLCLLNSVQPCQYTGLLGESHHHRDAAP